MHARRRAQGQPRTPQARGDAYRGVDAKRRLIVRRIAGALLASGAGFALFLAIWTVLPAPTNVLLIVAVVGPELALPLSIASALIALVALAVARGRARGAAVVLGVAACGFALVPMTELPATVAASDAALRAATGRVAAPGETTDAHPFDALRAVGGGASAPEFPVRRDLPVLTADGARLGLDLYRASLTGPRPTVVLLYGGAWQFGKRANMASHARAMAALGYTAIAIDYRHAPAYRFPVQRDDVRAALATIARNTRAWNVDPDRVALFGESAGAELALLAAYEPGPLRIRAAIAIYAPFDLTAGYDDPPRPDPIDVRSMVATYLGGPPSALPAAYQAASPRDHVRAGLPPTLLIGGARDELCAIRFQRRMRDALVAAGDRVASLEFPWSNHGFAALPAGLGGQLERYYSERFLAETMRR